MIQQQKAFNSKMQSSVFTQSEKWEMISKYNVVMLYYIVIFPVRR